MIRQYAVLRCRQALHQHELQALGSSATFSTSTYTQLGRAIGAIRSSSAWSSETSPSMAAQLLRCKCLASRSDQLTKPWNLEWHDSLYCKAYTERNMLMYTAGRHMHQSARGLPYVQWYGKTADRQAFTRSRPQLCISLDRDVVAVCVLAMAPLAHSTLIA